MNPLTLRLKGFRGILAGLGLEEVFLDLTASPAGLIAITGPNGAGKTTVMDNLHPYRLMPYKLRRAKDWSPASFSFYEQCYGRDASKELFWEANDVRYRSLLLIDAEKRKQEAYLYQEAPDRSIAAWTPLNDGKTKTYDAAVEAILGSPTLFFSSVFRSQGARNLSDYSRGDIMAVISELLNIDGIKEQSEKARAVAGILTARRTTVEAERGTLAGRMMRHADCTTELAAVQREVASIEQQIAATTKQAQDDRGSLQELRTRLALADGLREQLASQEQALAAAQRRVREAEDEGHALGTEEATVLREQEAAVLKVRAAFERAEKMLAHADEVHAKVAEEATLREQLAGAKEQQTQLQQERYDLGLQATTVRDLRAQLTSVLSHHQQLQHAINARLQRAADQLAVAQRDAAKLDGVDCKADGSAWVNAQCAFVSDAVAARGRLPELQAALDRLREEQDAARDTMETATEDTEAQLHEAGATTLDAKQGALDDRDRCSSVSIRTTEASLEALLRWTRLLPEVTRAATDRDEHAAELAHLEQAHAERRARLRERLEASQRKAKALTLEEVFPAQSKVNELRSKVDALQTESPAELERRVAEAEQLTVRHNETLRQRLGMVGRLEQEQKETAQAARDAAALGERISRFDREITRFRRLERALSNNGVISLEIEDSGPGIAALANDLLDTCYGPRFSVRIETQAEKRDGSLKDSFDVMVLDSETGEAVSITEKSGGQVTWIEDAITRAICLYQIHGSGKTYHALFTDEADGSLDADRKREFVAVKRRAMEIGAHEREFFVSQTPELVEMANAKIVVGDGAARLVM